MAQRLGSQVVSLVSSGVGLREKRANLAPNRIHVLTTLLAILALLSGIQSVHSQTDFTRIYGPEDQAVPTPSFVGTIGQQDASAVQEITEYRAVVNASGWKGLQASGTFTDNSGSLNQTTLTILGIDQFRLDVNTSHGVQSTRISGQFGSTVAANGKAFGMPPATARGGMLAFPRLLAASFPDAATTIVDRGQVQLDGALLHRITIETLAMPTQSSAVTNLQSNAVRNLNVTDLYFNPTSHLLVKSASSTQLSTSDRERYLIVVTYGDYQTVGSSLVPLNFVQTMNGQRQWVLQLNNPNLQPSVAGSYFHF